MPLWAGAATRDISPDRPIALFGYPHTHRVSRGVHDPILASALYVRADEGAVVCVALDILMLDSPAARSLRRAVAEAAGAEQARVFISCTHTHSAPVTATILGLQDDPTVPPPEAAYLRFIEAQTVAAAAEAVRTAAPAELAWTTTDATGVGGNRREPGGPTDGECGILAVRLRQSGAMLAVSLIYGMHPTVLHEDSKLVSADFVHYARLAIRDGLGTAAPVVYHTAPCGDQSPRHFVRSQSFAEAERLGRMLGSRVVERLSALGEEAFEADPPLAGALREVRVSRRELPDVAEAEARLADCRGEHRRLGRAGAPRGQVRTAECAVFGAEATLTLARAQQSGRLVEAVSACRPIEVQAVRIGKAVMVGLPGELFAAYGLAIKSAAAATTFVVSLVNGELLGYVTTPEAMAAGGYEATNSVFGPEAGRAMVDAAVALTRELAPGGQPAEQK